MNYQVIGIFSFLYWKLPLSFCSICVKIRNLNWYNNTLGLWKNIYIDFNEKFIFRVCILQNSVNTKDLEPTTDLILSSFNYSLIY